MSFGLQRVVLGTWSRDGHVLPPSWERAVLRLTITGPSYEERLIRSGSHCREPLTSYIVLCPYCRRRWSWRGCRACQPIRPLSARLSPSVHETGLWSYLCYYNNSANLSSRMIFGALLPARTRIFFPSR